MASSISSYGNAVTDKGTLYYEQEGNAKGSSILFIHGLGGTTNVYQPLVSSLQDYNLIRFDWAGHGRSSLTSSTSIDSYVENAEGIETFAPLTSAFANRLPSYHQTLQPLFNHRSRPLPRLRCSDDPSSEAPFACHKSGLAWPNQSTPRCEPRWTP